MLTARTLPGGFGKDSRFEVTASGSVIATINETKSTFEMEGRCFSIARSGVIGPTLHLKSGDQLIATLTGKPFVNTYILAFAGREWTFKATTLTARKFGLFENERQTGTFSPGSFFGGNKDITADLPDDLPREVQLFLLSVFIGKLTER
jgi:hypothetical protein